MVITEASTASKPVHVGCSGTFDGANLHVKPAVKAFERWACVDGRYMMLSSRVSIVQREHTRVSWARLRLCLVCTKNVGLA